MKPLTPTRVMLALAGLLTLLSMSWTAWSVVDLIGHTAPATPWPVAVAVAVAVELVWVAVVATEWQQIHRAGRAPRALTVTGWGVAAATVVILAVHAMLLSKVLLPLALVPLGAKSLWHWALTSIGDVVRADLARRAEEAEAQQRRADEAARRARELDTGLTEEQRRELAERHRHAAYIRAITDADLEVLEAQAAAQQRRLEVEHRLRMEEQQRAAELRMSREECDAKLLARRAELERELMMARPVLGLPTAPADNSDDQEDDRVLLARRREIARLIQHDPQVTAALWKDLTRRLDDGPGGVPAAATPGGAPGGGLAATPGGRTPEAAGGTAADLGPEPTATPGGATRRRVWEAIQAHGPAVSTRWLATHLGLSRSTVRDHRNALEADGYEVYSEPRSDD